MLKLFFKHIGRGLSFGNQSFVFALKHLGLCISSFDTACEAILIQAVASYNAFTNKLDSVSSIILPVGVLGFLLEFCCTTSRGGHFHFRSKRYLLGIHTIRAIYTTYQKKDDNLENIPRRISDKNCPALVLRRHIYTGIFLLVFLIIPFGLLTFLSQSRTWHILGAFVSLFCLTPLLLLVILTAFFIKTYSALCYKYKRGKVYWKQAVRNLKDYGLSVFTAICWITTLTTSITLLIIFFIQAGIAMCMSHELFSLSDHTLFLIIKGSRVLTSTSLLTLWFTSIYTLHVLVYIQITKDKILA